MSDTSGHKAEDRASSALGGIDAMLKVTRLRSWIALGAFGILVGATLAWAFLGELPVTVSGRGMLLVEGGIHEVIAPSEGTLKDIYYAAGEVVEKGRTVARIDRPDLLGRIRAASTALEALRSGRVARGAEREAAIVSAEAEVERLKAEHDAATRVLSPVTGRILELTASDGEYVVKGSPVARLELSGPESGGLQALLYFPAGSGEKIERGMVAQISPLIVEPTRHGLARAIVTKVSDYPASKEAMRKALRNEALVEALTREGAPIEVLALLVPDPATKSGYAWSSGGGPPFELRSGWLCDARVKVASIPPLSMILPLPGASE